MKIGFVSLDWSSLRDEDGLPTAGGAGYYRMVLPARTLAANGVDVVVGCNLGQKGDGELVVQTFDMGVHEGCDIIVLQRWMDADAAGYIEKAKAYGQVVINEVDDLYDAVDPANRAWLATHPKANPNTNRAHYKRVLAASSALTVSTQYLADHYRGMGKPVYVLENCIDLARWTQRDVSGDPVVGWVGATGYRSGDLEVVRGTLGAFLRRNGVPFHHSGDGGGMKPAAELLALGDDVVTTTRPMASIVEYPKLFQHFNIGIVPLADKAFNRAKSHIKGLEYSASGIPFVASNLPEYERFPAGQTVSSRARDWQRALSNLLDSETRVRAGAEGRRVAERYDIADRWTDWLRAYKLILAGS